ncbi:uncharacterized protein BT62DRAFT_574379 [Guyanagaster necrorhizus]|uniref:Uncharacterized protein n=1 Tax=Guyanagaster necrorhizus TaxID=856835 RepID=A0A9P7VHS8_9AGAR|nr:uncharacterized protein BT62DRAFT_574379 [Guyanagaster necrorhizus MCA 3950]KAG7440800.1 hypothetical protein BT62DRAFT_574379 [Guyanagaster necrorhizus MCA 3950]
MAAASCGSVRYFRPSLVPGLTPTLAYASSSEYYLASPSVSFVHSSLPLCAWIYRGETYGLIVSTIHQYNVPPPAPILPSSPTLYTDHLNSCHIISSALSSPCTPYQWSNLPGRSLYRWLLYLPQHSPPPHHPPTITYTPAHTNSLSIPSQVNSFADLVASNSQWFKVRPPLAPLLTFSMDLFMLYSPNDGYIETNISKYVSSILISRSYSSPDFHPASTMLLPLYDQHSPPEHPYLRASSAFSALV